MTEPIDLLNEGHMNYVCKNLSPCLIDGKISTSPSCFIISPSTFEPFLLSPNLFLPVPKFLDNFSNASHLMTPVLFLRSLKWPGTYFPLTGQGAEGPKGEKGCLKVKLTEFMLCLTYLWANFLWIFTPCVYILLLFDLFLIAYLKCEIGNLKLANTSMLQKCTVKKSEFHGFFPPHTKNEILQGNHWDCLHLLPAPPPM